MDELKACPFCGEEAKQHLSVCSWVECKACGAKTPQYQFDNQSIDAWDRRTQPENKVLSGILQQIDENEYLRKEFCKRYGTDCPRSNEGDFTVDSDECDGCPYFANSWLSADASTQPENKPLSLEQLYSLVGKEPIYAVSKNNACWCVLDTTLQFGGGTALIAIYGRNMTLSGGDYGKTWLAYAHKPEGSET